MKNIELVNNITKSILDTKDKIESLKYKIGQIQKPESRVEAMLELEIDNNTRSRSRYYISKGHVLLILQERLTIEEANLQKFEKQYIAIL